MFRGIRRILSVILLLLVIVAATVVPVYILLGIQTRFPLFLPYAVFVGVALYAAARIDSGKDAPVWRPGPTSFFAAHVFLSAADLVGTACFLAALVTGLSGTGLAVAIAGFALLTLLLVLKALSGRNATLRDRPLLLEIAVDLLAAVAVVATAFIVLFR
jgi:hypothetical protein